MQVSKSIRIAPETLVLAAVCLLDLMTTVFWVSYRDANEGNPIMAYYLREHGTYGFIVAKIVLCAVPLFVAEWGRRSSPRFTHNLLRFGIFAYIAMYGMGVVRVNGLDKNHSIEREAARPAIMIVDGHITGTSGFTYTSSTGIARN